MSAGVACDSHPEPSAAAGIDYSRVEGRPDALRTTVTQNLICALAERCCGTVLAWVRGYLYCLPLLASSWAQWRPLRCYESRSPSRLSLWTWLNLPASLRGLTAQVSVWASFMGRQQGAPSAVNGARSGFGHGLAEVRVGSSVGRAAAF